ncbi:hypothetical protein E0L13_06215 [Megasphaera sp. SW808]|uniref:hypothetical protein n=1 Tax=Megasphaera sp. SW808 TaxID=2530045 RepID=UPI001438DCE2|nr:hypothetical protein [Megasphaera sp. SW808]NJE34606.1 hypothetical protein [Megasphaera sp. SW808]
MKMEEAKMGMKVVDTDTVVTGVITHIDRELGVITVDDRQAPYGEKRFAQNYYDCGALYDIADLEIVKTDKVSDAQIRRYAASSYVQDKIKSISKEYGIPYDSLLVSITNSGKVFAEIPSKHLGAEAKCHPDDKFDINKGLELAFERLAKKLGMLPKWEPKEAECFYYVMSSNGFVNHTWHFPDNLYDKIAVALGNCFKTKEEAEKYKDEILERYQKLSEYAKELNQ